MNIAQIRKNIVTAAEEAKLMSKAELLQVCKTRLADYETYLSECTDIPNLRKQIKELEAEL